MHNRHANLFTSREGGEGGGEGVFHHEPTRRRRRLHDSWAERGRQSIVVPAGGTPSPRRRNVAAGARSCLVALGPESSS